METKTQTNEKKTRTTEERLNDAFSQLLYNDIDLLISETAGAYMTFTRELGPEARDPVSINDYQNVLEFLLVLKDVKAEYGTIVNVSIKKHES